MTDQLKPCPFCGNNRPRIVHPDRFCGYCPRCGTIGPMSDTAEDAAAAWDHRPAEDALRAELDAMRAVVDAAVQWHRNETTHGGPLERELERAVDAYIAAREGER